MSFLFKTFLSFLFVVATFLQADSLKQTGQTTSYTDYDDGYYKAGVPNSYTRDDALEIVTDNVTKLVWQDNSDAKTVKKTCQGAKDYCESLDFAGHTDWRLPTIKELQTIVDDGVYNPAINATFQNVTSGSYWSSTTLSSYTSDAWGVYFYNGGMHYYGKTDSRYVRCVRTGE